MQKYPNTGEMASTRYSSESAAAANETGVNKTPMAQSSSLSSSSSSSGLTLDDSGKIIKPGRSFDDDDTNRGHGETISAAATSKSGVRSSSYHGGHNAAYSHAAHSSGEEDDDDDVYAVDDSYHHQQHNHPQHHLQAYHPNYHHQDEHMMAARQRHESAYSSSSVGTTSRYDATTGFVNPAAAAAAAGGGNPYDRSDSMTPTGSSSASMVKKARGELTCVVCGAAANGYNFDAITCESCKAFFRRNAFRPLNLFRCSNNNACQITVATRKKCKKCRIMKCFNLGMRRDWIMTEVEREEKRRKIAINKTKSGGTSSSALGMDESSQESQYMSTGGPGEHSSGYPGSNPASSSYHSETEMGDGGGGINNKPIRRRRRRRRAGFGAGPPPPPVGLDPNSAGSSSHLSLDSPHIPSVSSFSSSMHGYGLGSYGQPDERSYIPNASPSNASQRHSYSPSAASAYYDPSSARSVPPPGSVGSTGDYNNNNNPNATNDDSMSKRKKRTVGEGAAMLETPSNVEETGRYGLLEQYKMSNTEKIMVGRDVELKTRCSELEREQISAILEAYKQAIKLVKAQGIPKSSEDINTTINLTELGVRRLIFFFKLISDFRNLDHDLMVKLLKKNMMNLIQIHGVNSYNKKEDTFKEPNSDDTPFAASSLESIYGPDIYKLTIGITQNLFDLCNGDTTYIKILLLIVLFDPMNDQLSESERAQIVKLQNKYVTLFHAYMCDSFGCDKGSITFKSIIYEMNKVNDLALWFEKVVAEKSNYEYVRPLMKEVFSLPQATPGTSTTETSTPPASVAAAQTPSLLNNAL